MSRPPSPRRSSVATRMSSARRRRGPRRTSTASGSGSRPPSGDAEADGAAGAPKGALDGIARSLPALAASQEMQERAANLGYDWPTHRRRARQGRRGDRRAARSGRGGRARGRLGRGVRRSAVRARQRRAQARRRRRSPRCEPRMRSSGAASAASSDRPRREASPCATSISRRSTSCGTPPRPRRG